MTVRINKDAINLREKLSQLDKPSGLVGEELLRADTSADAREALNLEEHLFEDFESTGIDDNATSTKVTVSDSGLDVTGTVTADGLTVRTNSPSGTLASLKGSNGFGFTLSSDDTSPYIQTLSVGGGEELAIASSGKKVALFKDTNDIHFYEDTGTTAKMVWDASAESLAINGMTMASSGAVRTLSTHSTAGLLRLNGGTSNTSGATIDIAGDSYGSGDYVSILAGTTYLSGNVGIGTASPSGSLDVGGQHVLNDNYDAIGAYFRRNGTYGSVIALGRQGVSDGATLDYPAASTLGLSTNGTERARIDSSGNLLVGTTDATTNCKLKVTGAVKFDSLTVYTKAYSGLDTIGQDIAALGAGFNGTSTMLEFTGNGGGSGSAFKIIYNCWNAGGTWNVQKEEIVTSSRVDVTYDGGVFTFKSKSGTQSYTPRVKIEALGTIDTSYLS